MAIERGDPTIMLRFSTSHDVSAALQRAVSLAAISGRTAVASVVWWEMRGTPEKPEAILVSETWTQTAPDIWVDTSQKK